MNDIYKKFALEAALLVLFLIGLMILMQKHGGASIVEDQEDAHLKRLFGDAWKEAKKL